MKRQNTQLPEDCEIHLQRFHVALHAAWTVDLPAGRDEVHDDILIIFAHLYYYPDHPT